jgi:hypothetical protein
MQGTGDTYPRRITDRGELAALGVHDGFLGAIRFVELDTAESFVVAVHGQTVSGDIQGPSAKTPFHTLKVEISTTSDGARVVADDGVSLDGVWPGPLGGVINLALVVAEQYASTIAGRRAAVSSFLNVLAAIAPRGVPAPGTDRAIRQATVAASRVREEGTGDVVVTLTIRYTFGGYDSPDPALFE